MHGHWIQTHHEQLMELSKVKPTTIFFGDSIVEGLERYPSVWKKFVKINCQNMGIGGDRVENLLHRISSTNIPKSVESVFILIGSNNIGGKYDPQTIAIGIIECGLIIKKKKACPSGDMWNTST